MFIFIKKNKYDVYFYDGWNILWKKKYILWKVVSNRTQQAKSTLTGGKSQGTIIIAQYKFSKVAHLHFHLMWSIILNLTVNFGLIHHRFTPQLSKSKSKSKSYIESKRESCEFQKKRKEENHVNRTIRLNWG